MEVVKVAVVGAGGVGGYFGGKLAAGGVDTTFIVRGRTLEALRTNGLRVESVSGDFAVPVKATSDPSSVGPVDAVLMTVKAWQIAEAAASIRPLLGADTVVVPLENGMEAPEILSNIVGVEYTLGGLCAVVSFAVAPGHIRHIAPADPFVMFGELDNRRSERVERLRATLAGAGVNAEVPPDIHRSMWTKFLFICVMSGMGAMTRVPLGIWRAMPETRALAERALREIIAVAEARGVTLDDDAFNATLGRLDMLPPESTSSLQRDVMEGKPSELDAQIGAVVRMAAAAGVPAPVHEMIYACLLPQERNARA